MRRHQVMLEKKLAELLHGRVVREELQVETYADPIDQVRSAVDRDIAVQAVDRQAALVGKIREALERVKEGTFGECLDCGGTINPRRLEAIPWAPLCVHCQERHEQADAGMAIAA